MAPVLADEFVVRFRPTGRRTGLDALRLGFHWEDDPIAILRFTLPHAGETRLMVAVELYPEDNEVVGKVYDAQSRIKCATERREAHFAGSVRATVSCLLRELAANVAGDPSF